MITGGCGCIGSVVLREWTAAYPGTHFVNLDKLTYAARPDAVSGSNYTLVQGDICDADLVSYVLEAHRPTLLLHLAAESHVDTSFGNSMVFSRTNILGTHTLLECARKYGQLRMFLHMSTDEVYGEVVEGECSESSVLAPTNPYAGSKAAAEMLCHAYHKSFGLPVVIARCNNAVSPFQHVEKLIPRCVDCVLRGAKIPVQGDGSSRRTFIHARDIARALAVMAERAEPGRVFNIGNHSGQEYTVVQVIQKVLSVMGVDGPWEDWAVHVPDRAFQDRRYGIDSSALRSLGWSECYTLEDGIREVWDERKNNTA